MIWKLCYDFTEWSGIFVQVLEVVRETHFLHDHKREQCQVHT